MRTAILIASGEAMLSLHPTTDVERKLVALMSGEVEVSLHHTTWSGKIGGVYRQFQGLGGELIVVVKPKDDPRPEDPAPREPAREPRDYADPDNPLNPVRAAIWSYAEMFEYRTPLQASYELDEVMAKIAGLLTSTPLVSDPAPGPETTTREPLVQGASEGHVAMVAHDVYRAVLESREHDLAAKTLKERRTSYMTTSEIVSLARKAAADAAKDAVLRALNLNGKAEDPAPTAAVLQLRRDVKWLEDRGVRGQVSLLSHTLAEMVGLDASEFVNLTLKTRQKFENRAYTALRALNSGAKL